jgi:stress-induced morphogen
MIKSITRMEFGTIAKSITSKLQEGFLPTHLEVIDESHKHAGHAAMIGKEGGESHFKVVIVSDLFKGMMPLDKHRAVNECLKDEVSGQIHALQIEAKTEA